MTSAGADAARTPESRATLGAGLRRRRAQGEPRVGVSSVARLADSHLPYGRALTLDGKLAEATRASWRGRGFGDFWGHVLVASESAEAMVEDGVGPWDMATPYVVVTAAGGRMTNLDGWASSTDPQLLTSNGLIHDELLSLLVPAG